MRPLVKDDPVWRLAGASKFECNHGGTFSPSSVASHHSFGWDRKRQELVIMDYLGMAGNVPHRMPIPLELAELFLRRCQESAFAQRFLESYCPKEEEKETLEIGGQALQISCSAYRSGSGLRGPTLPTLSLVSGSSRLWLFFELRDNFARRIKTLAPESISTNLRPL